MNKWLTAGLALLSACYLNSYPLTPAIETESTYKIFTTDAEGVTSGGTAWVASPGVLVTAGHMCQMAALAGHSLVLKSEAGRYMPAHWIIWELSSGPEADACIIRADGPVGPPLVLARSPPIIGTPDFYVGYPNMVYSVGRGIVAGPADSTAPADHGASGSAVSTDEGVYMVITQAGPGGHVLGTPIKEVRALLDGAGISYTLTPPALPPDDDRSGDD
jgi:hypothetical protein